MRFENGDASVYETWEQKAEENVEKWGQQEIETLLLAMQEEVGELAQAYLEHTAEGGEFEDVGRELDDLAALCIQLRWALVTAAPEAADGV